MALQSRGYYLKDSWYAQPEAMVAARSLPDTAALEKLAINTNLEDFGIAIPHIAAFNQQQFASIPAGTSIVLQCNEIVDISRSLTERAQMAYEAEGASGPGQSRSRRLLKLLLTDGVQNLVALEAKPIAVLDGLLFGGKLRLTFHPNAKPSHRNGMFMMVPANVQLCGGHVPKVQAVNDFAMKELQKQLAGWPDPQGLQSNGADQQPPHPPPRPAVVPPANPQPAFHQQNPSPSPQAFVAAPVPVQHQQPPPLPRQQPPPAVVPQQQPMVDRPINSVASPPTRHPKRTLIGITNSGGNPPAAANREGNSSAASVPSSTPHQSGTSPVSQASPTTLSGASPTNTGAQQGQGQQPSTTSSPLPPQQQPFQYRAMPAPRGTAPATLLGRSLKDLDDSRVQSVSVEGEVLEVLGWLMAPEGTSYHLPVAIAEVSEGDEQPGYDIPARFPSDVIEGYINMTPHEFDHLQRNSDPSVWGSVMERVGYEIENLGRCTFTVVPPHDRQLAAEAAKERLVKGFDPSTPPEALATIVRIQKR